MPSAVSVLMPAFEQPAFIARALDSLLRQKLETWECLIIDDGSADETFHVVEPYLVDPRFEYHRLDENRGLGAALNFGLDRARAPLIAYLPSDDVYYADHLLTLSQVLAGSKAMLAYSGVRHHYDRSALGQIEGTPLQLVQVMHRRTEARWIERWELATDDLDRMFWSRIAGERAATGRITCEWVDHPEQRHKIIQEPIGGINRYRSRFRVTEPLRYHSSTGSEMNERALYARCPNSPPGEGLKIVLAGELAYNPDRVVALEEHGHRLYGLWMPEPFGYNTVGPLPFGRVEDLPRSGWQERLREIQPDIIYGLLNWQAVPWAHYVMTECPEIPFVWHFKEGPFICLNRGTWPELLDLYTRSDGQIYCTAEMRDWFLTVEPDLADSPWLVLDGDLPKREWFDGAFAPKLSDSDGEFHTVVPGRPIGLHPPNVADLARNGIHLHFYGEAIHALWREWIATVNSLAPGYLHLHPHVDQSRWVSEFSKYDAGWLHFFESRNKGELRRADFDDMNCPARIGPLLAAGLPLLQRDNRESIVATQTLVREHGIGLFFQDGAELAAQLRNPATMAAIRAAVLRKRDRFTFDFHVDRLAAFFRQVIARRQKRGSAALVSVS